MAYDLESRRKIFDRADGNCHICHRKLSFANYGIDGAKGAWHVEHSKPRSKGGTDHGNNLYPAHISCNLEKSDFTTRTARAWHGTKKAPLSKAKKQKIREGNADAGTLVGGVLGAMAGPIGIFAGALLGRQFGRSIKPPKV